MSGGEINHIRNDVAGEPHSRVDVSRSWRVVRSRAAAITASRLGGSKRPLIGRVRQRAAVRDCPFSQRQSVFRQGTPLRVVARASCLVVCVPSTSHHDISELSVRTPAAGLTTPPPSVRLCKPCSSQ